jgi:hypothetical protein
MLASTITIMGPGAYTQFFDVAFVPQRGDIVEHWSDFDGENNHVDSHQEFPPMKVVRVEYFYQRSHEDHKHKVYVFVFVRKLTLWERLGRKLTQED